MDENCPFCMAPDDGTPVEITADALAQACRMHRQHLHAKPRCVPTVLVSQGRHYDMTSAAGLRHIAQSLGLRPSPDEAIVQQSRSIRHNAKPGDLVPDADRITLKQTWLAQCHCPRSGWMMSGQGVPSCPECGKAMELAP